MITWTVQGTNTRVGAELGWLVQSGQLHPMCPVSADGGRTWIHALDAAQRMNARGDDGLALIVPMRTGAWATGAQYVALFSLLFFGGPICFGAAALSFDHGPTIAARLVFTLVATALGPLPVGLMTWLGHREIKKDPTLRGKGRLIFALVCTALMALACVIAFVGSLLR
jgi:hypothetical protein